LIHAEQGVKTYRELVKANQAFLSGLVRSNSVLGSVLCKLGNIEAAKKSFREGLTMLLPVLEANYQAHRPLADALAQDYFATLQRLGQEPDPDLMAANAAAFADAEAHL
jgi:hypothetical protein